MSKKSIGTGITRLLFGLKGKDLKVIPFNEMSPQQFEQLDRLLGKVGFLLASNDYKLTTKQANYVINQIKQLDLYRERIMPGKNPDFKDFIPRDNLGIPGTDKAKDFKGFKPKIIPGGKDKTRPGNIDYDKMSEFLGVKLRGDETFEELLEIEKRMKGKDPEKFAGGGVPGLLAKLRAKFGKEAITTADKIDRPARAKLADEFKAFNKRIAAPTMEGKFTKAEFVIERMKNSIKGAAGKTDDESKYILETFPNMIKELEAKPELANNPNVWKMFSEDLPKNQKVVVYGDDSVDFFTKTDFGPQNIKLTMDFAKKHNLTVEEASRILKMEPEDRVLELTRVKATRNMAKGGLATMFRPKREEFIFGGGVGFKNLLKSIGKKQGIKGSDVLKQGNPKSQVPKRAKPFVSARDKENMKELRIQQLENQLELLKTSRNLLANRDNFPPQFREVGDDMIRMMMPPEMKETLKGSTIESLDKEILQLENVIKNLRVGKDKRKLNADGGLATMFRPRLKNGGPPNPGRRTFLKLMAGLASIPILGKLFKPAAKVSTVVPLKNTTTTMPDWFPSFVDKITTKNIGEKIDADVMLFKDKDLPGVEVYKYDDGRINVTGQNEYYAQYDIDYTPPGYEVVDFKTGKAVKTKGEFEAVDADPVPDYDGSIADYEPRVLDDVDEIMTSDARRMEAYATGKSDKDIPIKSGEGRVIENEVRADQAADYARENYDGPEDFAKGGLATMFKKK